MKSRLERLKTFGAWALVTGASSGIGAEFARQLAENGLNVVLAARRQDRLEALGDTLERTYGVQTRSVCVDLSDPQGVPHLGGEVADLDIGTVISNAGTGNPGRFLDIDHDRLLELFRLNALSHLNIAHQFGRRLAKKGGGALLLGGAMGAENGIPFMANDAGSKAYVQSLSRSLHVELKPAGLHVTVLVIPPTDTEVIDQFGLDRDKMPMKPITTTQCVSEGLAALERNKALCLPGTKNRMMRSLIPASVARIMMGKMIEKTLLSVKAPFKTMPTA